LRALTVAKVAKFVHVNPEAVHRHKRMKILQRLQPEVEGDLVGKVREEDGTRPHFAAEGLTGCVAHIRSGEECQEEGTERTMEEQGVEKETERQ